MLYTLFKNLLFRPVIKFLYGARVENEANIPATGGVILASNHLDAGDTVARRPSLAGYLNTIYFGRGTNGIQTAARAYFGVDAKDLTLSQAALIAGIIPSTMHTVRTALQIFLLIPIHPCPFFSCLRQSPSFTGILLPPP